MSAVESEIGHAREDNRLTRKRTWELGKDCEREKNRKDNALEIDISRIIVHMKHKMCFGNLEETKKIYKLN